jgi:hypothetical protein
MFWSWGLAFLCPYVPTSANKYREYKKKCENRYKNILFVILALLVNFLLTWLKRLIYIIHMDTAGGVESVNLIQEKKQLLIEGPGHITDR